LIEAAAGKSGLQPLVIHQTNLGGGSVMLSVYDKGAPAVQQWMKDGLLRYAHQKEARVHFQSARLQLPREGSKAGNNSTVLQIKLARTDDLAGGC
jgi:hypothetical protein